MPVSVLSLALWGTSWVTWPGVRAHEDVFGGTAGAATKRLRTFLGDRADAAVTALRNTRGMVPGEMPTAGRAASANLPELKALEEAAMRSPGAHNLMTQRDVVQHLRPSGAVAFELGHQVVGTG